MALLACELSVSLSVLNFLQLVLAADVVVLLSFSKSFNLTSVGFVVSVGLGARPWCAHMWTLPCVRLYFCLAALFVFNSRKDNKMVVYLLPIRCGYCLGIKTLVTNLN